MKNDSAWRERVVEHICSLIRFMGEQVDRHDPYGWYAGAPVPVRK